MAAVTVTDLTLEYASGGYGVRPIHDFHLSIDDGTLLLLLGASGSGKTSLLSALASLLRPARGSIVVDGVDVTTLAGRRLTEYRRRGVGVVFQGFNLVPSLTAVENVAMPLWAVRAPAKEARRRAEAALERVGLADRLAHRPAELSGGQAQRVAIARALIHDPPLVLADEPTAHLDYLQVEGVVRLLRELAAPGRVIVVATHDERLLPIADRVVELTPRLRPDDSPPSLVELEDGEVLFDEGDRGTRVFVVDSGEIELRRRLANGDDELVARYGPGSHFGELAPMLGFPRSATAVAVGPTVVLSLPFATVRERLRTRASPDLDTPASAP